MRTRKNPELLPGNARTLIVIYGPGIDDHFIVNPRTTSWTKAAEFIMDHFPGFWLVRDGSLAGGHWDDRNGVVIELW